jgi:Rps23 Pro-64 3,4-dihydroxylase Tpa1-like proline 4-hydroxylase
VAVWPIATLTGETQNRVTLPAVLAVEVLVVAQPQMVLRTLVVAVVPVVELRVALDRVLVRMVVAELLTSVIQPNIGIRLQQIRNPQFLKSFVESNKDNCSLGSTNKRITNILNIGKSPNTIMGEEFAKFVQSEVNPIIEQYRLDFGLEPLAQETSWLLLKYDKGHFFNSHIDDGFGFTRTVSAVIFANDNYSGGELVFDRLNVTIKPVFGDMLIFPSSYPFAHSVKPIVDGVKYSIVNWYTFSGESHGSLC